jgi:transcriptional regulator with XRE-family HTH domain
MEIKANIGRRIAEAFNYQSDSEIASLLTISNKAVKSFIDGEEFPPIEILLSIRQVTDVSLDWLLTTEEVKQGSYTKRFSSSIEPVVLGLA